MRRMFISSTFQKSCSKIVYFREILLRFFYWVSTWLVYTLIQLNSPWKGENCLKRITLLGSERKSVSTFLCLFFEREGQWDIFTWFCLLKLVTKLGPVFCGVETRDDCISSLLLQRKRKNTGLRLMVWKTLEHNFRFCVGLGNNLITFMPPFCVLSEGRQTQTHIIFTIRRVSCLFPLIYLISKKNHFE